MGIDELFGLFAKTSSIGS